jgi:hypothetical protein
VLLTAYCQQQVASLAQGTEMPRLRLTITLRHVFLGSPMLAHQRSDDTAEGGPLSEAVRTGFARSEFFAF